MYVHQCVCVCVLNTQVHTGHFSGVAIAENFSTIMRERSWWEFVWNGNASVQPLIKKWSICSFFNLQSTFAAGKSTVFLLLLLFLAQVHRLTLWVAVSFVCEKRIVLWKMLCTCFLALISPPLFVIPGIDFGSSSVAFDSNCWINQLKKQHTHTHSKTIFRPPLDLLFP